MYASKIAILLLIAALSVNAAAQNAILSVHLSQYTGGFDDVSSLVANPSRAPSQLTFDLADFGTADNLPVKVTLYLTADHGTLPGVLLVDTYLNLRNTGLTIAEFSEDEAGHTDARRNANSHRYGNSNNDGAGNDTYVDNAARWFDPNAPGDRVSGPLAAGRSVYTSPVRLTSPLALYSFVVRVPRRVGVYALDFARVQSGGVAEPDPRLKTAVLTSNNVRYNLSVVNGSIEVVPEPASVIALSGGLVGLLALRRRKK